jgi:hypothetical protein
MLRCGQITLDSFLSKDYIGHHEFLGLGGYLLLMNFYYEPKYLWKYENVG